MDGYPRHQEERHSADASAVTRQLGYDRSVSKPECRTDLDARVESLAADRVFFGVHDGHQ